MDVKDIKIYMENKRRALLSFTDDLDQQALVSEQIDSQEETILRRLRVRKRIRPLFKRSRYRRMV